MLVSQNTNTFGNQQSIYQKDNCEIIIETTQDGGYIVYNDRNGEGMSRNGKYLERIGAEKGEQGFLAMVKAYGWKSVLKGTNLPEDMAMYAYDFKVELAKVFGIDSESDHEALVKVFEAK
ncbi:hypothetical protein [Vibrio crassostreae]|uniref:hypothetical protein n=1 Tax=Vibrio crassostreae TaxID=246167 RepID=UPI001B315540|nr:hypothetical protein [Vibrio crassostreae]